MKSAIYTFLLVTLGSTFSVGEDKSQTSQKPLGRSTSSPKNNWMELFELESKIIENCKGNEEFKQNLKNIYDDMKSCISTKELFKTPKQEYLSTIDYCSLNAIVATKNCLKEDNQYFPEFILSLVKSVVTFLYDDQGIMTVYYKHCVPNMLNLEAQEGYIKCVAKSSARNGTEEIPSQRSFCKTFIPSTICFANLIQENCERFPELDKFRNDFIRAHTKPCDL